MNTKTAVIINSENTEKPMENYLVIISFPWQVIVLVIRDTSRNRANKQARRWIKANRPDLIGRLSKPNFQIHDFSNEAASIVYQDTIYLS